MIAIIDVSICDRSPTCPVRRECPVQAVSQIPGEAPVIDSEKCTGCGICESLCPMGAVSMK